MHEPMLEGSGASYYHLECLIAYFAENLYNVPKPVLQILMLWLLNVLYFS